MVTTSKPISNVRAWSADQIRERVHLGCAGYREEVHQFLAEVFVASSTSWLAKGDVYHCYEMWCRQYGFWIATMPCFRGHVLTFSKQISEARRGQGGVNAWIGLDWRDG